MYTLLLTSIDSLLAAFGFGLLTPDLVRRRLAFYCFFLADGWATALGLLLRFTHADWVSPVSAAMYLVLIAVLVRAATKRNHVRPYMLAVAATFLSLDNLAYASAGQTTEGVLETTLFSALSSGGAALIGISLSKLTSRWNRPWLMLVGGAAAALPLVAR